MEGTGKPATIVKCEKHGLHYDSARHSGCVLCRREAGELPAAPSSPRAAAPAAAAPGGSLVAALAVTAVLIGITAVAMQSVHATFIEWLRSTGNTTTTPGLRTEYEQKQMDGVMKELKEQQGGDEASPTPGR